MKEAWVLLILVGIIPIHGLETACTYTSKAGDYYDLSPLSTCNHSGLVTGGGFVINLCNTVSCGGANAAVCQNSGMSAGDPNNAAWSDISTGKGVVLRYSGGGSWTCPNNIDRSSVINLICSPQYVDKPKVEYINENPPCTYNFNIYSKYACPVPKAPQVEFCPKYIHLVPHSHDDVGWIYKIDEYYETQVKKIIDTYTAALAANPDRKFIQVEQAYFWRWWNDKNTSEAQRQQYTKLVKNGQIEFVIGGWVMQDEACTTYGANLDQMTQGHQFLLNIFGPEFAPTKGWQIDPFGAGSATPTLNKLSGLDAHIIDRITNKEAYDAAQRLEFIWQGSSSLGEESAIFTNIMDQHYGTWYEAFSFGSDPVNAQNVASWGQKFLDMATAAALNVRTPHVLAAWGDDFQFQNATADFHSMDLLLAWLKSQEESSHIYVRYSTVSEYFAAELATPGVEWPVNQGSDFFGYYTDKWWTGYYTSQVQLKGVIRNGEAAARAAEPIFALAGTFSKINPSAYDQLYSLRLANADAQHHDGITGTSFGWVVDMYREDLIAGMAAANSATANIFEKLIQRGAQSATLASSFDQVTNIKLNQTIALVVYNSLGWTRDDIAAIPIARNDVTVTDEAGKSVVVQFVASPNGNYTLYFPVSVGPLGYATFFVQAPSKATPSTPTHSAPSAADTMLQNKFLSVFVSGQTGLIGNVTNIRSGAKISLLQNIEGYVSKVSGAYAFGPAGPSAPLSKNRTPQITVSQGPLVDTIHQVFPCDDSNTSYAKQTIRLFHGGADVENYIELDYELGPLPSHRELVATFDTSIFNQGIFATDANGYEFIERSYQYANPIAGNYYPTQYASFIRDSLSQLTVVSERAHGACGSAPGKLEIMIHRNPDQGDNLGPPLTDTTTVFPSLRIIVDTPANSPQVIHKQTYLKNFPLSYFTSPVASVPTWIKNYETSGQLLAADLPVNIHLQSLTALNNNSTKALLRLTHLFALDEDYKYSTPVTVNVAALFKNAKMTYMRESTATGNKFLSTNDQPTFVTLTPKQIRSFVVEFTQI